MNDRIFVLLLILLVATGVFLLGTNLLCRWLGLRREQAFLLTITTLLSAAALAGWEAVRLDHHPSRMDQILPAWIGVGCRALLVLFSVPFAFKVYGAWLGNHASEGEKSPGAAGLRAWLSPAKVILAALIAACAAGAYDFQFAGVLALLTGCLLIQPLVNTVNSSQPAAGLDQTLASEREKVLSLLENGRITAEESADLLNALGTTAQPTFAAAGNRISPQRRMVLIGAGMVLLAFFLPWFSLNPGKELSHLTGQMQEMMQGFPMGMDGNPMEMPNFGGSGSFQLKTSTIHISGGDVTHGFGWLVLLFGLGAAVFPYTAGSMDAATQRTISLIALGIGGIVLVYLATQNIRLLNIGLPLSLAGYVLEFLGVMSPRARSAEPARSENPVVS